MCFTVVVDVKQQSSIPRFAAFAMKKKAEAQKKTITPGKSQMADGLLGWSQMASVGF